MEISILKLIFIIALVGVNVFKVESQCLFEGCTCMAVESAPTYFNISCPDDKSLKTSYPNRNLTAVNMTNINIFKLSDYTASTAPKLNFSGIKFATISFINNQFVSIDNDSFFTVDSLTKLEIKDNAKFSSIQATAFKKLSGFLSELILLENLLGAMDSASKMEIGSLASLKRLTLGKTLTSLDIDLSNMKNLVYLDLSGNKITELKDTSFKNLVALEELKLSSNMLNNTLSLTVFSNLSSLKTLDLSKNYIKEIKSTMIPKNLMTLDLSSNQISNIDPTAFQSLTSLTVLKLMTNKLTTLDSNLFSKLSKLQTLDLSDNNLVAVPNIYNLASLELLDLTNQNGKLEMIADKAFDRESSTNLTIRMFNNMIKSIGNQTFCTKKSLSVYRFDLPYSFMTSMHACHFKQIRNQTSNNLVGINLDNSKGQATNLNFTCCNLKVLANNSVSLSYVDNMLCQPVNCSLVNMVENSNCYSKPEYSCPVYTSSAMSSKSLYGLNLILLISIFLLNFIKLN